ncbi:MAG: hypothetical protein SGCHY_001348 [Lobulomycetales sp.]
MATRANSVQVAERVAENLTAEELQRHVAALARYAICSGDKFFKREDALKVLALPDTRLFPLLVLQARSKLLDTFGLALHELPDKKKASGFSGLYSLACPSSTNTPQRNSIPVALRITPVEDQSASAPCYTLLCIVLSLIYTNGGDRLKASELFDALRAMGIQRGEVYPDLASPARANPSVYRSDKGGTLEQLLAEWVKEHYLDRVKAKPTAAAASGDMNTRPDALVEYGWGPRAGLDIGQEGIREFIAGFYPDLDEREAQRLKADLKRAAGDEDVQR